MHYDELEAKIAAAVLRYLETAPPERPALFNQDADALVAELWMLSEDKRKERVHQLVTSLIVWRAMHAQRRANENRLSKN